MEKKTLLDLNRFGSSFVYFVLNDTEYSNSYQYCVLSWTCTYMCKRENCNGLETFHFSKYSEIVYLKKLFPLVWRTFHSFSIKDCYCVTCLAIQEVYIVLLTWHLQIFINIISCLFIHRDIEYPFESSSPEVKNSLEILFCKATKLVAYLLERRCSYIFFYLINQWCTWYGDQHS